MYVHTTISELLVLRLSRLTQFWAIKTSLGSSHVIHGNSVLWLVFSSPGHNWPFVMYFYLIIPFPVSTVCLTFFFILPWGRSFTAWREEGLGGWRWGRETWTWETSVSYPLASATRDWTQPPRAGALTRYLSGCLSLHRTTFQPTETHWPGQFITVCSARETRLTTREDTIVQQQGMSDNQQMRIDWCVLDPVIFF